MREEMPWSKAATRAPWGLSPQAGRGSRKALSPVGAGEGWGEGWENGVIQIITSLAHL